MANQNNLEETKFQIIRNATEEVWFDYGSDSLYLLIVIPSYRFNVFRAWVERCMAFKLNTLKLLKGLNRSLSVYIDGNQVDL